MVRRATHSLALIRARLTIESRFNRTPLYYIESRSGESNPATELPAFSDYLSPQTTMRAAIVVAQVSLGFALSVSAQAQSDAVPVHQQTSAVPGARFEVVQSELAARWTFRLDRYSGRIAQLVGTRDSSTAWEETPVEGRPQISAPSRPRFQIFTSGLAARHTFLVDTDTGKTWLLVQSNVKNAKGEEEDFVRWVPFARY